MYHPCLQLYFSFITLRILCENFCTLLRKMLFLQVLYLFMYEYATVILRLRTLTEIFTLYAIMEVAKYIHLV